MPGAAFHSVFWAGSADSGSNPSLGSSASGGYVPWMSTILKSCGILFALLLCASVAQAQTYTTSSQFKWDAPTNAMDAGDAQAFTTRVYINGSATGVALTGVTCGPPVAPDVTFSCSAPVQASMLNALNRRKSSAYITSEDTTTPVSGESGPSNTVIVNRRPNNPNSYRQAQ